MANKQAIKILSGVFIIGLLLSGYTFYGWYKFAVQGIRQSAGFVVSSSESEFVIQDRHLEETRILLGEDTKIRFPHESDKEDIEEGDFVHVSGKREDKRVIYAHFVRLLSPPLD
ncbi:MAG: hypothetical protein P1V18_05720 [Candidatus Gracilibacteria bacterium]|nr:hypothetical protein [Candidatus Gracilibacteria bacterium]